MDILVQGFLLSSLYALVAIGFSAIYGVGGVLNLSHAGYVMISGYVYYTLHQLVGVPIGLAFVVAIASAVGLSLATYRGLVRYYLFNPTAVFLSTIILALVMDHAIVRIFDTEMRNVLPIVSGTTIFFGAYVSYNLVAALIVSWLCLVGVLFFVRRTHLGRAMRALAMDRKGAVISGIDPERVNLVTWALAGGLAGIAGIFYSSYTFLSPAMWVTPLVMSFAIVIIGGLGSIEGTLIGAHIIGFMETITTQAIDPALRGVFAMVIMVVVLIVRPKGLLGR